MDERLVSGATLTGFEFSTPDKERISRLYEALCIDLELQTATVDGFSVELTGPRGQVRLSAP